jgi:ribonuclease D
MEAQSSVAVDTESDSFHHYFDKVCLVQVALASGEVFLVDPLAIKDLSPLGPVFASTSVEKVVHGGENDIALLKRDHGLTFAGLFDTQPSAEFAGRKETSLQALVEQTVGHRISKAEQRTDWSRRPLSKSEETYAAGDVTWLLQVRDALLVDLRKMGREAWAREEGEALAHVPAGPIRSEADPARAKGWRELGPKERGALRELYRWREDWAKRVDRPLFKVVPDVALLELATRRPKDVGGLKRVKGLGPWMVERAGGELLAAVVRGEAKGDPGPPAPSRPARNGDPSKRMTGAMRARVDRLRQWRTAAAPKWGLEPGVLLPQRLIDRIAVEGPADLEALSRIEGLRRWRVSAFGADLVSAR